MVKFINTPILLPLAALASLLPQGGMATVWSDQSEIHVGSVNDDYFPVPAITPDGTVWAFWDAVDPVEFDGEIYYSRWNGQAWDPPQSVNPPNTTTDFIPKVSCAPDGTLWVLWLAPAGGAPGVWAGLTSRWTGTGWTPPDTAWADGTRQNVEFAAVSATEAWFVREGSGDIYVNHTNGATRDPVYRFNQPNSSDRQPTITVDSDGVPWAAWASVPPPGTGVSQVQYSRYTGGAWQPPQLLPKPTGVTISRIVADQDNNKWIISQGDDPSGTYVGDDIWAARWSGSDFATAVRISDSITSNDSLQVYVATSRMPGELPRVVWVRGNLNNSTRRDVMTTAWDGTTWTPPELVGNLADSSYLKWPDVAVRGEQIWAMWMRDFPTSGSFHIVSVHALPTTTAAFDVELEVEPLPNAARIRWRVDSPDELARMRILRASGLRSTLEAPSDAVAVGEIPPDRSRSGTLLDSQLAAPSGYTYWLELLLSDGHAAWIGPRQVTVRSRPMRSLLSEARPNPTPGNVELRGWIGIDVPFGVDVFSVTGRRIRRLNLVTPVGATRGDAQFSVVWDGRNDEGVNVAGGVYFAKPVTEGPVANSASVRIVILH